MYNRLGTIAASFADRKTSRHGRVRAMHTCRAINKNLAIANRSRVSTCTCTHDMPYLSATFVADLPTMSDRRDQLSGKFFNSTPQPTTLYTVFFLPFETNYPSLAYDYEQPQNSPVSPPEQKSSSPFSRMH